MSDPMASVDPNIFNTLYGANQSPSPYSSMSGGDGGVGGMTGGAGQPNAWNQKLGANIGTANLAMNGLSTIAGLWSAFQQLGLAKKQFKFQKEFGTANLNNQVKGFNEALDGKARSRAVMEGQSAGESQAYYDRFKAEGMKG